MVALIGGILIVIVMVGLLVSILFLSQKRVQSQAEELALSMATFLNKDDLTGQMNNMVQCARELVFAGRNTYHDIANHHPRMKPMALQLAQEAREGAQLIESERRELVRYSVGALNKMVKNNSVSDSRPVFKLPWLSTYQAAIYALDAGYIERVHSNVRAPEANPELKHYDIESKFLDVKTDLYLANINARLPSPDDDLNFKLCSLPPPVRNTVAPARLTSNNAFKSLAKLVDQGQWVGRSCDQLPSAVNLVLAMQVTSDAIKPGKQDRLEPRSNILPDRAKTEPNRVLKAAHNSRQEPIAGTSALGVVQDQGKGKGKGKGKGESSVYADGQVNTTVSAAASGGMELP